MTGLLLLCMQLQYESQERVYNSFMHMISIHVLILGFTWSPKNKKTKSCIIMYTHVQWNILFRTPWNNDTSINRIHVPCPKHPPYVHYDPWNQDTSLIRTLFSVPRVSGWERFHCIYMYLAFTLLLQMYVK